MASSSTTHRGNAPETGRGSRGSSENEQRILRHGHPGLVNRARSALTTKRGSVFCYCDPDGDIDDTLASGYGIYFHDMRFLDRATLRMNGMRLTPLLSTAVAGHESVVEMANREFETGGRKVREESIRVRRERRIGTAIEERITVRNYAVDRAQLSIELEYGAHFEDMFVVRGADRGERGTLHDPAWHGNRLAFEYDGADHHRRTTTIEFRPSPASHDGGRAAFHLTLEQGAEATIECTIHLEDAGQDRSANTPQSQRASESRLGDIEIETGNAAFDDVLRRCFGDLKMLLMEEHGDTFFAAGVPWYVALFGRDTLITTLETLPYDLPFAANSLRVLAHYQGTTDDEWRDEEPGKILHELRTGEKANLHEVPQTPYYGTVDATPLFVILLHEYLRWSGDQRLFDELRDNVLRAINWLDNDADHDGDGFVDYVARSHKGLVNQGWKDSGNGVVNRDGSLARPPIGLVEVQGYVYRARLAAASLFERTGDPERADRLRSQAVDLRERFAERYWMPDRRFLAFALQDGGEQVASLASNGGQALWSGIVAPEHADHVADRLMSPEFFSGWGIRTLASSETGFNPLDYQVGSVWPHDNALIAVGLKQYGHHNDFLRVFTALFEAARQFAHYRLPEVFAGTDREAMLPPVRYPVACLPQAWASASLPYLLWTALGLEPDAWNRRLDVVRPILPDWLPSVTIRGVRVGDGRADLRFERGERGARVEVVRHDGVEVRTSQR